MDKEKLKQAALALELEVSRAKAAGYANADCVYTPEVEKLVPLAKAECIESPVELFYTAGPSRVFLKTNLGDCTALERAWVKFKVVVQGLDADPVYKKMIDLISRLQTF